MRRRNKFIYWIATLWLALGMVSTGMVQFLRMDDEVQNFTHLGYPVYLMTILAVWKILGVAVVLIPGFPLLKEWAYAGFFFAMSGAVMSHVVKGDGARELFGPMLLLILTVVSWYFRPANRKINSLGQKKPA